MTHRIITAAAIVALMATPVLADSPVLNDESNNPRIGEIDGTDVASQRVFRYDTSNPRISNGIAEFDANQIALSQEAFKALSNTRGAPFATESGEVLGVISAVDYNERGFPELVVDLEEDAPIDAKRLIVTVQPENVTLRDGQIFLAVSVDELIAKAEASGVRNDLEAEVTIF